ncbi:MAG: hypothetical protein WKG07_19055 [Hymenobacter sp.]
MQFNGFPYLGLWTKGPGAAFVCIEPWQGVASSRRPAAGAARQGRHSDTGAQPGI